MFHVKHGDAPVVSIEMEQHLAHSLVVNGGTMFPAQSGQATPKAVPYPFRDYSPRSEHSHSIFNTRMAYRRTAGGCFT